MTDVIEQANAQLVDPKPFVKFIGYKFEDMLFDLKALLFMNQMDTKLQNDEEEFQALLHLGGEGNELMKDEQLIVLIDKMVINDHSYQV